MSEIDPVLKTLIAEAYGEGDEGMRMVAETILTRADQRGLTPAQVVAQPYQYTGYSNPGAGVSRLFSDPQALSAAQAAWELAQGPDDPTGGANHYLNPKTATDLSWMNKLTPTVTHGGHAFYTDRPVRAVGTNLDVVDLPNIPQRSAVAAALAQTPMQSNLGRPASPMTGGYQDAPRPAQRDPANYAVALANAAAQSSPALAGALAQYGKSQPSVSGVNVNTMVGAATSAGAGDDLSRNPVWMNNNPYFNAGYDRNAQAMVPVGASQSYGMGVTRPGQSVIERGAPTGIPSKSPPLSPAQVYQYGGPSQGFYGDRLVPGQKGLPANYGTFTPAQVNAIGVPVGPQPLGNKSQPVSGFGPQPRPTTRTGLPGAYPATMSPDMQLMRNPAMNPTGRVAPMPYPKPNFGMGGPGFAPVNSASMAQAQAQGVNRAPQPAIPAWASTNMNQAPVAPPRPAVGTVLGLAGNGGAMVQGYGGVLNSTMQASPYWQQVTNGVGASSHTGPSAGVLNLSTLDDATRKAVEARRAANPFKF